MAHTRTSRPLDLSLLPPEAHNEGRGGVAGSDHRSDSLAAPSAPPLLRFGQGDFTIEFHAGERGALVRREVAARPRRKEASCRR